MQLKTYQMKFLILFSFLLLPILLFPYFYKINKIDCISQYGECSVEVLSSLEGFKNKPVKEAVLSLEKHLSENKRIREYKLIYRPLADITIELIEEKATVAVKEANRQEFLLVSQDRKVINTADHTTLPKVFISKEEIKFDSPEAGFASSLLIELAKYYDISEAILDESSIVAVYKDELKLTFPVTGDVDMLLGSLELLLFQLKRELPDTKISSIDLRYKNVIVK